MDREKIKIGLETMLLLRAFDDRVGEARDDGLVPGLPHLSTGHEAVAACLADILTPGLDKVTGSHRSHALALALGVPAKALMAEIMGREDGTGYGMGGTQHIYSTGTTFLASNGIVGAQVPIAAGAALSAKTLGSGGIAVAVLGDGAINQGSVLETMNLAAVLRLPILFMVENNGVAQASATTKMTAGIGAVARARALSIPAESVDGCDYVALHALAAKMIAYIRLQNSPALIETSVSRMGGHYHGDKQTYGASGSMRDPITNIMGHLKSALPAEAEDLYAAYRKSANDRIEEAYQFALSSSKANAGTLNEISRKANL